MKIIADFTKKARGGGLILALTLAGVTTSYAAPDLNPKVLPYSSPAYVEDMTALEWNPAGLGFHNNQLAYYYGWLDNYSAGDSSFLLNLFGLSLGWQNRAWRDDSGNQGRYGKFSLGQSFSFQKAFSLGLMYDWYSSEEAKYDTLTNLRLAAQILPSRWFSTGIHWYQINQPHFAGQKLDSRVDWGVGLRPLGTSFLTLSYDFQHNNPDNPGEWYEGVAGARLKFHGTGLQVGGHYYLASGEARLDMRYEVRNLALVGSGSGVGAASGAHYGAGFNLLMGDEYFTSYDITGKVLEIDLRQPVVEKQPDNFLFLNENQVTMMDLVTGIRRAAEDDGIRSIFLIVDNFRAGYGRAGELRAALAEFKKSGKKIVAWCPSPGNKEYYLASVADQVYTPESATIALTGLSMELYSVRDFLNKIGVQADFVSVGKYKSAPETLTRSTPSEANLEATQGILDGISREFRRSILASRPAVEKKTFQTILDKGFLNTAQAKRAGLVDGTATRHEALARAVGVKNPGDRVVLKATEYFKTKEYDDSWGYRPEIAIIYLDGEITTGESGGGGIFSDNVAGSETITGAIRKAGESPRVRGLILRINSPGGSGLASDLIYKEVQAFKKKGKPVIVSFGDVAASGGYYVAAAADEIITNKNTITGSIGVFGGKFSLQGLYKWLGVNKTILKKADKAAIFNESAPFTDEERDILRQHMEHFYQLFVERVASGRSLDNQEVDKVAQGRVWTGTQARERNLADRHGGLLTAIALMKNKLEMGSEDRLHVREFPASRFQFWNREHLVRALGIRPDVERALRVTFGESRLRDKDVLFLLPYKAEVE